MTTSKRSFDCEQGADTTFAQCRPASGSLAVWYQELVAFLESLAADERVQIFDNGFRQYPGVLVSDGVQGSYQDRRFSVFTDIPGELILAHGELRAGQVEALREIFRSRWLAVPAGDEPSAA